MALGDYAGRAHVNLNSYSAQAECDRCGCWWQLDKLSKQFQWAGTALIWTGYMVCPQCLDVPFEQYKTVILPPDPKPRVNPRPAYNVTGYYTAGFTPPTTPENQGFTQWALATAAPIAGTYPTTKPAVLAAVAALSGIPTPATISDQSITLGRDTVQTLLAPNATRTWMLIYNPTQQTAEMALGTAAWNGSMNLAIGAGEAWFWANGQNLTPVYQGIVQAVGLYGGLPLWAWDSSVGALGNDGGILYTASVPPGYQVGLAGLPAGSIYLVPNLLAGAFAIGVVPGIVPNPGAPAVFFANVTASSLLALGGGNLPAADPMVSGQLWNNGGLVSISQ